MLSNISIQAMHHVMTLKAIKVATNSQWTGPIIDIKEHCFGVVHPVTKQTISIKNCSMIQTSSTSGCQQ
jgi:hypothetical protein